MRFFQESCFPRFVGEGASIEDEYIPLLPNELVTHQKDFHEFILAFSSCIIQDGEKIKTEVPYDVERSLAFLALGA
jgi:hypothetical protein